MTTRFTTADIETWRRDGVVMLPQFFNPDEVLAVASDIESVFPGRQGARDATIRKKPGEIAKFSEKQFSNFENIPFNCSPALNLLCVHPALIEMARSALKTDDIQLYQSQAWAKYTGEADFDQPFHCDFGNHTLTVPSEDECLNAITFLIYFSDVTEKHGPTHYVTRSDSNKIAKSYSQFTDGPELQNELNKYEKSAASPAGSVFAYGIDVYHRGTNLTAPKGYRYAVTSCFKKAGNEKIGYMAWQFHQRQPWHLIFEHATPDQLSCFGVPVPGDSFWTEFTITGTLARYPKWDASPYQRELKS